MKITISMAMNFLFTSFTVAIIISLINFGIVIQKVDAYHYATVHEIESSDFSPYVINNRRANTNYHTEITEKSLQEDLRIYEVKTSTTIGIPLIGFSTTYVKESVAR